MEAYALIDAGDGRRLERFGAHVVDRPAPAAVLPARTPQNWADADLRFDRETGWSGAGLATSGDGWRVILADVTLEARTGAGGQVGVFPEHAILLPWLTKRIAARTGTSVLNLFAYTGLITVALARAGASVTHVDASRSAIRWARRNAALNGVEDRPVRWIVDDVPAFVAREVRRGRRYDGVVLDPPTYGRGASGKSWRLARDLEPLVTDLRRLLAPGGFIVLTAHTTDVDALRLGVYLDHDAETGHLAIRARSGTVLDLGAFARIAGAS